MITVRYEDEGPITYFSERDRELLERIKSECGGTIREIAEMVTKIILADQPFGFAKFEGGEEKFRFVGRRPFRISGKVPEPWARVDLGEAWEVAIADAEVCHQILEDDEASVEALISVLGNTVRWLRFWANRFPDDEVRIRFNRELEQREAGLAQLKSLGRFKEALEAI